MRKYKKFKQNWENPNSNHVTHLFISSLSQNNSAAEKIH